MRAKTKKKKTFTDKRFYLALNNYNTFQSSLSVHFVCVCVWSLSAECWCFSCSHYIAKKSSLFLSLAGIFFSEYYLSRENEISLIFFCFRFTYSNKSNNRSWWIFSKLLHILTFPKSKVTEFVYFVSLFICLCDWKCSHISIYPFLCLCLCVCRESNSRRIYFMTCYIHITDTFHGFSADEWFSRVCHQKRIILKCLSRCITEFRLNVKHKKIWNCLPTLNPNTILSYRRRLMKLRILRIFFVDGQWAETNTIIRIDDEKLKKPRRKTEKKTPLHNGSHKIPTSNTQTLNFIIIGD